MKQQLSLLEPQNGSTAAEPVKQVSWQQQFASYFYYSHKERTGKESKLKFGALKKMLTQHAEKMWVDEETGAPEIPSIEEWQEEVDAFWSDTFAAEQCGFHFGYLLKRYGSFKKFQPVKRKDENPVLRYTCKSCSHVMQHPRSKWMPFKNKTGKCSKCGTSFNVNDVLNDTPSLHSLLPQQ